MTYTAYIERQKKIIRTRHEFDGDRIDQIYSADTDKLFDDLRLMKGLNVEERAERERVW